MSGGKLHRKTYDGHKHKLVIVGPDYYRCKVPGCRRWYSGVNWLLRIANENPKQFYIQPAVHRDQVDLFRITLGER